MSEPKEPKSQETVIQVWNKETIRVLRRRLGWSQSDLARRLHCEPHFIEDIETGSCELTTEYSQILELISHQAEECCDQVQNIARAEKILDQDSLGQIHSDSLPSDEKDIPR